MNNQNNLKVIAFCVACVSQVLMATEIDSTDKHAWSENAGWSNFRSSHAVSEVFADHLEGYAWFENIGWTKLGTHNSGDSHSYANTSATNWGINQDVSGNLSGYAWSENAGWINFNPTHGQVAINASSGEFDGYAWSENIGWIHFNNQSPAYKVKLKLGPWLVSTSAPPAEGGIAPPFYNIGHNETVQFDVSAQTGYSITSVVGCGGSWAGSSPYVTGPITQDCTVVATFTDENGAEDECSFIVMPGKQGRISVICL
jgi:hypothetical protein